MATWDEARTRALSLPETTEGSSRGTAVWKVKDKTFAWERPLRRADFEALGDTAPEGPILGLMVPDLGIKEALLADDPSVFFTTPHFDGYPAILIPLEEIDPEELNELLIEAWLERAPKRVANTFLDSLE